MTSRHGGEPGIAGGASGGKTLDARRAFADDVLRNPLIAVTTAYCEALGLQLPRSVIRATLAASSEFPFLGLGSLVDAFDAWQVPNVAFEAGSLGDLPLPAIIVAEEAGDEGGALRIFLLALRRSEEGVVIVHPTLGEMTQPVQSFLAAWTGYAFVAEPDDGAGSRFSRERTRERLEDDEYRKSIQLLPGFLSDSECRSLIDLCETGGRFATSGLAPDERPGGGQERLSRTRTSDSVFLPDGDPLCDEIRRRAAERIRVSSRLVEPLQCVRYRPGQQFMAHYDAGRHVSRFHTLLIYLNEDFEGGETHFPQIGLTVRPRRGSALLFRNLDRDGVMIP